MRTLCVLPTWALFCACLLPAQTFTPKAVQLQGAESLDQAEILRLIDIKSGAPVTKEAIDAALQRLGDSGLFTDLSYKVNNDALVFVLTPAAGAQAQPVRFANFVWWSPSALEAELKTRVPLFQGTLPLTGQLTSQVESALVAMLAEKGIAGARVDAMQSSLGGNGVALRITSPEITVGEVQVKDASLEISDQLRKVTASLSGRDFDSAETPGTLVNNTLDQQRNAGYLDATVDAPVFAPPRKDLHGYAVDATATVHPGVLYRISSLSFTGVDTELQQEAIKAAGLKVGEPAREMQSRIAAGMAARVFSSTGHLEARATPQAARDTTTHTAAYTFALTPGPVYTLEGVDVTALSPDAQSRFNREFHARPGDVAGKSVTTALVEALQSSGTLKSVSIRPQLDRTRHTVMYVIAPRNPGLQRPSESELGSGDSGERSSQ